MLNDIVVIRENVLVVKRCALKYLQVKYEDL